ncbi:MAG: acetyltransferase [Oceanihabitans sp.]
MLESKNIFILGYSGHAYVVLDTLLSNNYKIKGYFNKTKTNSNPYNLSYLGDENNVAIQTIIKEDFIFPAIGSNTIRKKVIAFIEANHLNQTVLIDTSAKVSKQALIKKSTLVGPRAIINSMAEIGKGCIINSGTIIEHECKIGNFTHIAPGTVLAGSVSVGNEVFIGANATILPGIKIGNKAVIGAGAVVIKDIGENETWVGNPAKRII